MTTVADYDTTADVPRRTGSPLLWVTGGRMGLLGVWFAATLVLARVLGPARFGLYTLCSKAVGLVSGCGGDPVDAAVMRSAPLHLRSDRPRAVDVVRSAFYVRGSLGLGCVLVAGVAPWAVSWAVFGTVDHRRLALLTAAGVLGDLLLRSALGYFQVAETFGRFMAVDVVWQLGRAAAVAVLVAVGRLTAGSAVVVYVAAPYVAFAVGWVLLPADVRRPVPPRRAGVVDLLRYARWVAVALALAAVYERLDLFLLARFRGPGEVGVYAAAMALAAIPDFLDGCVQTVLAPRVAPAHAAGRFAALQRSYLTFAVPLGLAAAAAAVPLSGWGIRTLLPAGYAGSVGVFRILLAGTLFNLVLTPLPAALLNYVAPRRVTALTAVGLAIVLVGGVAVIPRFGASGAAVVIVCARVVVGTGIVVRVRGLSR